MESSKKSLLVFNHYKTIEATRVTEIEFEDKRYRKTILIEQYSHERIDSILWNLMPIQFQFSISIL